MNCLRCEKLRNMRNAYLWFHPIKHWIGRVDDHIVEDDYQKRASDMIDVGGRHNEKQQQYKALAKELMDLLIEYVPRMLQNEEYFTKVFPAS